MFFWSKIRKNRAKYNSGRGFTEEGITKILFDDVVSSKDVATAERKLLTVNGVKKFTDRLETSRERDDFQKHLRKYVNIWLPDCPFEVATTNRYTIVTQEAAVYARRGIKKEDAIKYLCGNLVAMTEEEEKDLDLTRRDFSIVMSSRKKTPSLFLGPARFANHDCNANARLTTTGSDGMQIVAVKDIQKDEEITVTYGEDYFGNNNCECLCRTCELRVQGGWTILPGSAATVQTPVTTREDSAEPYGFRRKRKYAASPVSTATTPDPETFQLAKRRRRSSTADLSRPSSLSPKSKGQHPGKLKRRSALSRFSPQLNDEPTLAGLPISAPESSPVPVVALPEAELKAGIQTLETLSNENSSDTTGIDRHPELCPKILGGEPVVKVDIDNGSAVDDPSQCYEPKTHMKDSRSSQISTDSTDVESIFENEDVDLVPGGTPNSIQSERERRGSSPVKVEETSVSGQNLASETLSVETTDVIIKEEPTEAPQILKRSRDDESDSELSDLSSDEEFDDVRLCIIRKGKSRPAKKRKLGPIKSVHVEPEIPQIRYPNDYVNTPMLLAEPESKWVQCKTCSGVWVQQNAYYTRRECPRCERHSKLYGYRWPKTEQSKGDRERIKDHREVHRFLDAEEEEELRRKQRDLTGEPGVSAKEKLDVEVGAPT